MRMKLHKACERRYLAVTVRGKREGRPLEKIMLAVPEDCLKPPFAKELEYNIRTNKTTQIVVYSLQRNIWLSEPRLCVVTIGKAQLRYLQIKWLPLVHM